jgi:hypothetical protein
VKLQYHPAAAYTPQYNLSRDITASSKHKNRLKRSIDQL